MGAGRPQWSDVFVITGQANKMQFYVEARNNMQYHSKPWGGRVINQQYEQD